MIDNEAFSVCNADNSCFYIGGLMRDTVFNKNYILKINPWGDTIWTRRITLDEDHGGDYIMSMAMTLDSGCIFTGDQYYVSTTKLDKNGNIMWQKQYGLYGILGRSEGVNFFV
jgi:hypothetical protein